MSFWQALTGNSSQIDVDKHDADLRNHLVDGEQVGPAYRLLRDYMVFTSQRIILVDKQGVTGSKRCYSSYPYARIVSFEVETKGTLDRDAEVRVFLQTATAPLALQFKDNDTAKAVGRLVAQAVLTH